MSEMPEDIMDVALAVHEELQRIGYIRDDRSDDAPPVYKIANAILAERQRCAAIADKWATDDLQSAESRLVAAYIRGSIRDKKYPRY